MMPAADWMEIVLFTVCLLLVTPSLGRYIYHVYEGHTTWLSFLLSPLEKMSYALLRIDSHEQMTWITYAKSLFCFNLVGFLLLFLLLLFQSILPLNPQNFAGLSWPLAFNIAVSFTTNTDWQSYAPEITLSYLSQMLGLGTQYFASAATGMVTMAALARGLASKSSLSIGNFWVDLIRSILYILLPLALLLAILLVSQGVIQNFKPYLEVKNLEGSHQVIPFGPVASQVAIKQLGSNGGGFFQANSAHPYENPTRISNFLENLALLLIPAAMPFAFGYMVHVKRQGRLLFLVMLLLLGVGCFLIRYLAHTTLNASLGVQRILEGKELNFGITRSLLWFSSTTASNGSTNVMLEGLNPLAIGIGLFNMQTRAIFGGVGVGLCEMVMFSLIALFLAGLLVGRTPEYIKKRIEKRELCWALCAITIPAAITLLGTSLSLFLSNPSNLLKNAHTLTETLYAFTSSTTNNGSALQGLKTDSSYYQLFLGIAMILGRIAIIFPSLAIAGSLVQKRRILLSLAGLSSESTIFAVLLVGVIITLNILIYFPALFLGPALEYILMEQGYFFEAG
jgi:K+-transporting ATPase ATPase A chain